MQIIGNSGDPKLAGVLGIATATGDGVSGDGGATGRGVFGISANARGIEGNSTSGIGVLGRSQQFDGVTGVSHGPGHAGVSGHHDAGGFGVFGAGTKGGRGVAGFSDSFQGVFGHSVSGAGVVGESDQFDGVTGVSHGPGHAAGVAGHHDAGGSGVFGAGTKGSRGVAGFSDSFQGVFGHSVSGAGVVGESDQFDGVTGVSHNPKAAAISGHNPGGLAGVFNGDVIVTGDITLTNGDCAEEYDIAGTEEMEPGTVMVLDPEGALQQSRQAYDKRVAGVISGAGDLRPGIVLDKQQSENNRQPIALIGKTYCKVDAQHSPIEVGDLLTTSPTAGHAMKADDPSKAFGSVIGKALRPMKAGQGMIPILIALQ
jgi:hypothetical protein